MTQMGEGTKIELEKLAFSATAIPHLSGVAKIVRSSEGADIPRKAPFLPARAEITFLRERLPEGFLLV
jgi:hypothetical protein